MPEEAKTFSLKCKVCGGDIRNDYLSGVCVCAHCGNKWSMEEMLPNYQAHTHAIEVIAKAKELLSGKPDAARAGQAKLAFKTAAVDCTQHPDAISSELLKICEEGVIECDQVATYAKGKNFFDKGNFRQAMAEFKKIPGVRDVDEMIPACEKGIIAARKKNIPLAIAIGVVLPAIIAIVLSEKLGLSLAICIPVFVVFWAATTYALYLEGTLATVIMVLSFLCAVPLIIFMVLAYGFNMDAGPAAALAVGIPIAVIIAVAVLPERS